jgi:hypothetical protein
MQGTIAKLLIAASTVLFVVVPAACTPDKPDDLPPYPDLETLDAEAGMAYPDTKAFAASTGTFDNSTLTLEQVLNQARLAAGEIVSYKSRGTLTFRSSTSGFEEPIEEFSEHASNGNYRFGSEYPDPYDDDIHLSEWRSVGIQNFSFNSGDGWKESSEPRSEPSVISASGHFLWMLDENDIELRSTNERTEDGVEVYRLVFSEKYEQPVRGGEYMIEVRTNSLLVSKESFRIIAWLQDAHGDRYAVSAASEIDADTHFRWGEEFRITEFYDFNEPVVIEIPDSYVPWSDDAVLSSVLTP